MIKKSRQKLKYLQNEKNFWDKTKNIFIIFKRLSVTKKLYKTWKYAFKWKKKVNVIIIIIIEYVWIRLIVPK